MKLKNVKDGEAEKMKGLRWFYGGQQRLPDKCRTSTDHVDEELVKRLLLVLSSPKSRPELMIALDLRHAPNFRDNYLHPDLEAGYIEMTLPDKPKSIKQRYRLTDKGIALKRALENK